jgi:hypothetical protein
MKKLAAGIDSHDRGMGRVRKAMIPFLKAATITSAQDHESKFDGNTNDMSVCLTAIRKKVTAI